MGKELSEIDFDEIEKAMAELVNKAQGRDRQNKLHVVARSRSAEAKDKEVAREQGDIATKRIIAASNKIRSNPRPINIPPVSGPRIMDFKVPAASPIEEHDDDLHKTVGQLSDSYLQSEVSSSDTYEAEPLEEYNRPNNTAVYSGPSPSNELAADEPESSQVNNIEDDLEGITGPVSSSPQGSIESDSSILEQKQELSDGGIHKIYGQRLPKEYIYSKKGDKPNTFNAKKSKKPKRSRKGLSYYFIAFMIFAAMVVWSAAIYLYFI